METGQSLETILAPYPEPRLSCLLLKAFNWIEPKLSIPGATRAGDGSKPLLGLANSKGRFMVDLHKQYYSLPSLPQVSTASGQKLVWFAALSGLHTFPPILQCVFFHYPCLKTDSLIYGHLGLQALGSPQTRALNGNSWASLLGGLRPPLCPWRNRQDGCWGLPERRGSLGNRMVLLPHKEGNSVCFFIREGCLLSTSPAFCWPPAGDETLNKPVVYVQPCSLSVTKTAFPLWDEAWQEIFFFKFFISKNKEH